MSTKDHKENITNWRKNSSKAKFEQLSSVKMKINCIYKKKTFKAMILSFTSFRKKKIKNTCKKLK